MNFKLVHSIFRGTHFWCASFFYNRVHANLRYVSICHSPGVLLLMLMSRYVSHSPGGASIVTHAQFWQLMLTMISLPTFPEYLFHDISEGFDVWRQTEIFFENSISTKKEVVEAGICCHAMLWQILIHPKSGWCWWSITAANFLGFPPKFRLSNEHAEPMQCCARFSDSCSHTLCCCKWKCRVCRFSPVDNLFTKIELRLKLHWWQICHLLILPFSHTVLPCCAASLFSPFFSSWQESHTQCCSWQESRR